MLPTCYRSAKTKEKGIFFPAQNLTHAMLSCERFTIIMVTAYQGLVTKPQSLEKLFTPIELINCSKQQIMDCFSESKCCNAVQKLYLEGIIMV